MKSILRFLIPLMFLPANASDEIGAECFLVVDARDGKVLTGKYADRPRQVASLTKVATALAAFRLLESSPEPGERWIGVPDRAFAGGINPLGLKKGDRITVEGALRGALLGSDNVSAFTLAAFLGDGLDGGGVTTFVGEMNRLANRLGMTDTRFENPHGLDLPGQIGTSTAADMARLGVAATRCEPLMRLCGLRSAKVEIERDGRIVEIPIKNTNRILGEDGIDGLKTGLTRRAGPCFLGTAERGENRLVAVVLNSEDRFADTRALLALGWRLLDTPE